MRVWQVSGGSASKEPVGWEVLRLDEATAAIATHQKSLAPRSAYKPGDAAMKRTTCQPAGIRRYGILFIHFIRGRYCISRLEIIHVLRGSN
jgi:hypothetical protein